MTMHIPILRWGQPYTSLETDEVTHFATGEPIAKVSRANGGLVQRDMRKAERARDALRATPVQQGKAKSVAPTWARAQRADYFENNVGRFLSI